MKLEIKLKDEWVEITPKSTDEVISKEDVLSHFAIAGYEINELDWEVEPEGICWYCPCCGLVVGHLIFDKNEEDSKE